MVREVDYRLNVLHRQHGIFRHLKTRLTQYFTANDVGSFNNDVIDIGLYTAVYVLL